MRDAGRRRVAVGGVDQHVDAVGGEHLERGRPGRLGERVGVAPEEQRAVDRLARPVLADRLGHRDDVGLVERAVEARAAVARRAERDPLGRVVGVGSLRVVRRHEVGDVDEVTGRCRLPGPLVHHGPSMSRQVVAGERMRGTRTIGGQQPHNVRHERTTCPHRCRCCEPRVYRPAWASSMKPSYG